MAGLNTLYPPIFKSTYMPAFNKDDKKEGCRVYFSLSNYNSGGDIANVQIIVNNQNNNASVLDGDKYPAEVKVADLQVDTNIDSDARYYINITKDDLKNGEFITNQYYKVQLRFTGEGAEATSEGPTMSWLSRNVQYFSEWSTVCLIKGIEAPTLTINGLDDAEGSSSDVIFTMEVLDFVGKIYFESTGDIEKEYLKFYSIQIYNDSTDELLFDSGDLYTNEYNPNEINYNLPYALEDGVRYRAVVAYITNNEYSDSKSYIFAIVQKGSDVLDATITATEDNENGRVRIDIVAKDNSKDFLGNITIRRSSSENNFKRWDDVKTVAIAEGKPLDLTWYDYTVESGVWYKYAAQKRSSKNGIRGVIIQTDEPIMMEFDSIFLTTAEMQLKIKLNASINSFKKAFSESRTETIGATYPHFRRNGNICYRQFSISGLIASFNEKYEVFRDEMVDNEKMSYYAESDFINRDTIYGDNRTYYDIYNLENGIDENRDYIYEREFREKAMDFLYNNDVKLFRSDTEGNILVKLMDISFTPNTTLGRMLYNFSATAYEIDECTLANYELYKIQTIGTWSDYNILKYVSNNLGQWAGTVAANTDVLTLLSNRYQLFAKEGYLNTVSGLKWLRIEFQSDPYLVYASPSGIVPLINPKTQVIGEDTAYGYIVHINGTPVLVNKRGYYEIHDDHVTITSVSFPVDTEVIIDYVAEIAASEDPSTLPSTITYDTNAGQVSGFFEYKESVYKQIYLKYLEEYTKAYQELCSINKLTIETDPGVIVCVRDSFDDTYYEHEIGQTGILTLYDEDVTIDDFYFAGVHLYANGGGNDEVRDSEYIETGISANSTTSITNPVKNGVYIIGEKTKIYYHGQWYDFDIETGVITCPVWAIIDYIYELIRSEY